MDDLFRPLKRSSLHVVDVKKPVDRCAYLLGRGKTSITNHPSRKNAEPDLHLVEPTCPRWCEMEMHILMPGKPFIMFWLMCIQIV